MTKFSLPNVPFVEAYQRSGKHRPTAIVIRNSGTTSTSGAALLIANYWHRSNAPHKSSHYVVDEANTYRCVPDKLIAGHWESSIRGAIVITICAEPFESVSSWYTASRAETLTRVAELVAELSLFYRIRVQYLDSLAADHQKMPKLRSNGGIVMDVQGAWPKTEFLAEIQNQKDKIRSNK